MSVIQELADSLNARRAREVAEADAAGIERPKARHWMPPASWAFCGSSKSREPRAGNGHPVTCPGCIAEVLAWGPGGIDQRAILLGLDGQK